MIDDPSDEPWWAHMKPSERRAYKSADSAAERVSIAASEAAGTKRTLRERARRRMKRAEEAK